MLNGQLKTKFLPAGWTSGDQWTYQRSATPCPGRSLAQNNNSKGISETRFEVGCS